MRSVTLLLTLACLFLHGLAAANAADNNAKSVQIKVVTDKACAELSTEDATRLALIQQMLSEEVGS